MNSRSLVLEKLFLNAGVNYYERSVTVAMGMYFVNLAGNEFNYSVKVVK